MLTPPLKVLVVTPSGVLGGAETWLLSMLDHTRRLQPRVVIADLVARTVLFLPQVIPLVAAGIAWSWLLASTGVVNQLLSLVGSWMQTTAQQYLVLELTQGSSAALGWVTVAQFTPSMVLSLFAGAIVDRVPRRRVTRRSTHSDWTSGCECQLVRHALRRARVAPARRRLDRGRRRRTLRARRAFRRRRDAPSAGARRHPRPVRPPDR